MERPSNSMNAVMQEFTEKLSEKAIEAITGFPAATPEQRGDMAHAIAVKLENFASDSV